MHTHMTCHQMRVIKRFVRIDLDIRHHPLPHNELRTGHQFSRRELFLALPLLALSPFHNPKGAAGAPIRPMNPLKTNWINGVWNTHN